MTGLYDTDIRLSEAWELTQAADGDAPLCSQQECFMQSLALEALTQPGDVFYDPEYGWGLQDFIQSEDDELVRLEITQRAQDGLEKHEGINQDSVELNVTFAAGVFRLLCSFSFENEEEPRHLDVQIDSVSVEVVRLD